MSTSGGTPEPIVDETFSISDIDFEHGYDRLSIAAPSLHIGLGGERYGSMIEALKFAVRPTSHAKTDRYRIVITKVES